MPTPQEATPLTPETRLDFHRASDHVEPAERYFGRQNELAQLAREATLFAEQSYVEEGIRDAETYANATGEVPALSERERIAHIGGLLEEARAAAQR